MADKDLSEYSSDSSETFGSAGSPPPTPSESFTTGSTEKAPNDSQMVSAKQRRHTLEQKRSMKRERKKRKRQTRAAIKKAKELQKQNDAVTGSSREVVLYKQMARHYWDRWQWELQKYKKEVQLNKEQASYTKGLHEIDPVFLTNPKNKDGQPTELYLGQGSFSIVSLKVYRGINVAVKQYRVRTEKADVYNEAMVLSCLCHPYLPYLFGMCTESSPYRLVMQFHGIGHQTVTLNKEMFEKKLIVGPTAWLIACSQLIEAISYIHDDVQILHNDIKPDNILLAADPSASDCKYQIVLSDFGKATPISQGRQYHFSDSAKARYLSKYPHIAPEVVHGESKQATFSDIYAVGMLFSKLLDHDCFFLFRAASRMNLHCYVQSVKLIIIAPALLQSNVWKQLRTWCNFN